MRREDVEKRDVPFPERCVRIHHADGSKDGYMVKVNFDSTAGEWLPKNHEVFTWLHQWFISEEYEFGEGFGATMPWFYACLCYLGHEEYQVAYNAYDLRGDEAKLHFRAAVETYIDDVRAELDALEEEVKEIEL